MILSSLAFAQSARPISGVIAATTSPVSITFTDADGASIGRQGITGDPIYLNDEIITSAESNLQILLKDQTVFTIGPDSTIIFDEFVYDPSDSGDAVLTATVARGAFKFISGKVSKTSPDAMTVNLPNATASIRGTTVAGLVRDDGSSDVLLLSGAIALTSDSSAEAVDIFTSGWGASISALGVVSDPFELTAEQVDSIVGAVEFSAPSEDNSADDAADENSDDANGDASDDEGGEDNLDEDDKPTAVAEGSLSLEEAEELVKKATSLEEVVAIANLVGDGKEDDTIDAEKLGQLLLSNDDLLKSDDVIADLLSEDNSRGIDIESRLVEFALTGQEPKWLDLRSIDGALVFGNDKIDGKYQGLISEVYRGSVSFSKSGLALSGDEAGDSGSADYTLDVDYDSLSMSGTLSVYEIVLGGRSYDDSLDNKFDVDIKDGLGKDLFKYTNFEATTPPSDKPAQDGHDDENANGILDLGETFDAVQTTRVNLNDNNPDHEAVVRMSASIGSIVHNNDALDGELGVVEVRVHEIDITDPSDPKYTEHSIGGAHYSKGDRQ